MLPLTLKLETRESDACIRICVPLSLSLSQPCFDPSLDVLSVPQTLVFAFYLWWDDDRLLPVVICWCCVVTCSAVLAI